MDEGSSAEFSYLCGLVELTRDDPSRARAACKAVRVDDFVDPDRRAAFRLIDDVMSTVEDPKWPDFQMHEHWLAAKGVIVDCIAESFRYRAAYGIGIDRFARMVRDAAGRRAVSDAVSDLHVLADSGAASSAELLAAADAVKEAAEGVGSTAVPMTLADAVSEYLLQEETPKIATGFGPLDEITGGGLAVGGLSVFAAAPSVGKSALALQACIGAMAVDRDLRVVWAMGEMTAEAFARRAICHFSTTRQGRRVDMHSAEVRSDDARGAGLGMAELIGRRMVLVKPPLSIGKIEDSVVESQARLLVIDYVQLVEMEAADRRAEIDGIVKRIRRLSLERNVAVLAISNVAKVVGSDTRIGAIGKESSELDFAADLFLLGTADEDRDADGYRSVRWACKKNRHGPCHDILTQFDGGLQTFYNAAATPVEDFGGWR